MPISFITFTIKSFCNLHNDTLKMTFILMLLNIMRFSKMPLKFSIMIPIITMFSRMTLGIMTLSIITHNIMTLGIKLRIMTERFFTRLGSGLSLR